MVLSAIVAASRNNVIGNKGRLPWNLPDEMAYFRDVTRGHPVIMGRLTHESIGRALPGRQNIVISSQPDYKAEGCQVVHSLEEALAAVKDASEVFIIGGSQIYQAAMSKLDKVYLTRIDAEIEGDKFFELNQSRWNMVSNRPHPADDEHAYAFDMQVWERKQ